MKGGGFVKEGPCLIGPFCAGLFEVGAFRCGGPLYVHGENMTYAFPNISLHVVLY